MKIHIRLNIKKSPAAGGSNFLKSLKNYFRSIQVYKEKPENADAIIFNSHHQINEIISLKFSYPDIIFVHRIDGPMKSYNNVNDMRDKIVYRANNILADATIFQSKWSKESNHRNGLPYSKFETTINNAPDKLIFNKTNRIHSLNKPKIRIIANSWSTNWNKGFSVYQWLDNNLDYSKYEFVFIGNSPVTFKNIQHIKPLNSIEMAAELKKSDIFLFASRIEACSNSLLEALHCGLPVVGAFGSSNHEIIGKGGELFKNVEEIPILLNTIINSYQGYQNNINNPDIMSIGTKYYEFIKNVADKIKADKQRKFLSVKDYLKLNSFIFMKKIIDYINSKKH